MILVPSPHLIHERFDTRKFVKHKKVAPTKFFPYSDTTKFFLENPKIPRIDIKLIVIRYFVEHNMVPLRKDSVPRDKKN